ncbi:MFS transporter [Lysinibacillus xylanilyticus]|uniref:MFS transporter n=1 Tax=Lysinibacillus xylanilyticus TaxID=582475 RepID=UPI002B2410DB|nr:MFS transporter [Lysinibacillus xylanilyticus]MEB2280126.1 MFS transporter [Lysinibacillus xylanilyticus]
MKNSIWFQKNFLIIWLSQTLQTVGAILVSVVIMVEVYKLTNSVIGPSIILTIMTLGSLLGGLSASFYIWRYELKKIINLFGWTRAVTSIILGLLIYFQPPFYFIIICFILIFQNVVGAWYAPARFSLVSQIIHREQYVKASGAIITVNQTVLAAGWAFGGILTTLFPFYLMIIIISICFLLSGFLVRLIDFEEEVLKQIKKQKKQLAWKLLFQNKVVLNITCMDILEGLANAIWSSAILLAFTNIVLKQNEAWWGFINAGYFIGAILGGLFSILISDKIKNHLGKMIALGAFSMFLTTLFFSLTTNPYLSVILCILMGPLYQIRDISQSTIFQDVLPKEERASIMAANHTIISSWTIFTYVIMGYLVELIGVQKVYIFASFIYLLTTFLVLSLPKIRKYKISNETEII